MLDRAYAYRLILFHFYPCVFVASISEHDAKNMRNKKVQGVDDQHVERLYISCYMANQD